MIETVQSRAVDPTGMHIIIIRITLGIYFIIFLYSCWRNSSACRCYWLDCSEQECVVVTRNACWKHIRSVRAEYMVLSFHPLPFTVLSKGGHHTEAWRSRGSHSRMCRWRQIRRKVAGFQGGRCSCCRTSDVVKSDLCANDNATRDRSDFTKSDNKDNTQPGLHGHVLSSFLLLLLFFTDCRILTARKIHSTNKWFNSNIK